MRLKPAIASGEAASGDLDIRPATAAPGWGWAQWLGLAISIAMLVMIAYEFRHLGLASIIRHIPRSPGFWLVLALSYAATPFFEWVIFRRLWSIPAEGIAALLRKRISNELLLGYLGEVQFYAWARRHGRIEAAPFGAIKDVAILSALSGNAVTLVMAIVAAPLLLQLHLGIEPGAVGWSLAVLLVTSAIPMLFRGRIFSLPARERRFVFAIHLARIAANILLSALLWHLVLPHVAILWWFLLATLRQLLSRLPFVPNKDLLFVGIGAFMIGQDVEIAAMIAMVASLTLLIHLVVGALLAAQEMARA